MYFFVMNGKIFKESQFAYIFLDKFVLVDIFSYQIPDKNNHIIKI